MIDYKKFLENQKDLLARELSRKEDSVILQMQRPSGQMYVLRIYNCERPAYRAVSESCCPNLPQVYDCGFKDGCFFVQEEYIDGISLHDMLCCDDRMDEGRAVLVTEAVCEAVSCLHDCGYIHRDIKAEHVLLTADNRVVLVDLDIAMKICADKGSDTELLGTTGYAAPEQFGFSRSDQRTDIYAIGILLNVMLTGAHPSAAFYKKQPLKQIIEKCTDINPGKRYQTARQLKETLHAAFQNADGAGEKKDFKGLCRKFLPAACLAILIAAIAVYGFTKQEGVLPESGGEDTALAETQDGKEESAEKSGQDKAKSIFSAIEAGEAPVLPVAEEASGKTGSAKGSASGGKGSGSSGSGGSSGTSGSSGGSQNTNHDTTLVEGTNYLQLYKEGVETVYYHTIQGRQAAGLYTESGERVDRSYKVYVDKSIGTVEWAAEWNSWGLVSQTSYPGNTGYLHAEKDGRHYAIRCLIFAEPMAVYTKVPTLSDLAGGYVKPQRDGTPMTIGYFNMKYQKGKAKTLYLVAASGFSLDSVTCSSSDVTIEPYYGGNYPYPVSKLTFKSSTGGSKNFSVRSETNLYTFYMEES